MAYRAVALTLACALAVLPCAAQTEDWAALAKRLVSAGSAPDAAALQLMKDGADAEDAAAALFEAVPNLRAMRLVAFTVVRAGLTADPQAAVPLAAGVAGLAQPAAVPAAIAVVVAAPERAAEMARAVSEAAPQSAPLIAGIAAKLAPGVAAAVAGAAAAAVPSQAQFINAAALQGAPQMHDGIVAEVARVSRLPEGVLTRPDAVVEAVGANALREAEEVLADLPAGLGR